MGARSVEPPVKNKAEEPIMKITKRIAMILAVLLAASLLGCGGAEGNNKTEAPKNTEKAAEGDTKNADSGVDWNTVQWYDTELKCLDAAGRHVYFSFPSGFGGYQEDDVNQAYITYGCGPEYGEGNYFIGVYYFEGNRGPTAATLSEIVEGELEAREVGGKTLWFGKMTDAEHPELYSYEYLLELDETSCIWIQLTDTEKDGTFRKLFEEKLRIEAER